MSEDERRLTVFQRLRDAAVRGDGVQLKAAEVEDFFSRLGEECLDAARVDDEDVIHSPPEVGSDAE